MSEEIQSRQEMFDRAWNGLAAQNWECAGKFITVNDAASFLCAYQDEKGRRCAWGHVDLSLTNQDPGNVGMLAKAGIGLAAKIDVKDLPFARDLQHAHDNCFGHLDMKLRMIEIARQYFLKIPGETQC